MSATTPSYGADAIPNDPVTSRTCSSACAAGERYVEVGGPEKFHLDELVARVLEYDKDPRKVVIDPDARYSGVKLSENSLIPAKDAKLGSTKFDWWLENVAPPPKK